MQIGPRPLPANAYPAWRRLPETGTGTESGRVESDLRRRSPPGDAPHRRPAERILQGELIDDASAGPRDRVNPYRSIDPARGPAILAYEQMQTVLPGTGASAGRYLDLFV